MKTCKLCKIEKGVNEFEVQTTQDGLSNSCVTCLQSARSKGSNKTPRGAMCDTVRMAEFICNSDYEKVPECYRSMIDEQNKLRTEMSRL